MPKDLFATANVTDHTRALAELLSPAHFRCTYFGQLLDRSQTQSPTILIASVGSRSALFSTTESRAVHSGNLTNDAG